MTDRFDRGVQIFSDDFGLPPAQMLETMATRVGSAYGDESIWAAGGPAWNDPAITGRDRSIAVISALICQGILGERLDAHLDRAVRNGLDEHAVEVVNLLLALYVGQARTSVAAEEIHAYFRKREAAASKDAGVDGLT